MKSPTPHRQRLFSKFIALAVLCHLPLANAQGFESPPPEIVSAWKANGDNFVAVFTHEGNFYTIQDEAENPGMERGTFTWNKATQAFNAETIVDTNGDAGFSHPGAATSISITGNTLSYTVAGEGTFSFTRVVNTTSAIVGSWYIPGVRVTLTFLGDGTYYFAQEKNDAPFGYDGIERGTYTWNPSTKFLAANAILDTNGDIGINGLPPGFTATVTGNSLALFDGTDTFTLRRITPVTAPLRVNNDFEVDKFANYRQTSDTSPALLTGSPSSPNDEFPFWGEAYIEPTVSGTGGTLTITGKPAISFVNDGGWGIYTEYTSLSSLNAALPNGANYVFARTGGSATLSYPAGGAFPPAPKIQIGEGAWGGGKYLLGSDQTLTWSPHTGYDPTTLATVISVVDQATAVEILYEDVIQGDVTSYNLSGKIEPGHTYDVQIEHVKIASSTTSGTGPFAGKLGYALYNSNTRFEMVAPDIEPPTVTEQPVSQPGTAGSPLVLTVGINQEAFPFSTFQWFRNNVAIEGQTGNSLYIPNYSSAVHAGSYIVKATNAQGTVTSNTAILGNTSVEFVVVIKDIEYVQTGSTTVLLNPRPVTPDYGGPFGFSANVQGQTLAAPTVTPPAGTTDTVNDPFHNTLFYDAENLKWRYGPSANDWGDLSQAAIDSRFPNGTYTFLVNGVSIPLSLTGSAYPNIPQLTLGGGSWVNKKYALDSANSLTVTTNIFTGYGSNADGHILLGVNDFEVEYFRNSSPATNFATYTVPGNTLPTNEVTFVGADFEAIVDKSTALAGTFAAAFYKTSVDMEVHILPKITAQSSSQVLGSGASVTLQVQATGTPATASGQLDYQWKKNGVNIPGQTTSSFGVSSFTVNDSGTYTCTVSNDVGSATSLPINLEFADAFQSYAASFGLNTVTTGAPDADSDNDGIDNLLEFVLGGSPVANSAGLLKTATTTPAQTGRNLVFFYDRKTVASGIAVVIETSPSLTNGTWTPAVHGVNNVTVVTTTLDANTERVTATIPSTETKLFVRLRANR